MVSYAKLAVCCSRVKVPMGFYAELPPVYTFERSATMDPQLGYWVVVSIKFATKTVVVVLFQVYDNYLICRLSRRMIAFMRKLSLKPVSGSDRKVEKFECTLNLISGTDSRRLPQYWCLATCGVISWTCWERGSVPVSVITIHIRVRGCWNVIIKECVSHLELFVLQIIRRDLIMTWKS